MRRIGPVQIKQVLEMDGIALSGIEQSVAVMWMNGRLGTCKKTCTDPRSRCAKRQSGSKPSPISDASRRNNWNRCHRVYHRWHQCHGCNSSPYMATCFPTLRDDDVSPTTNCGFGLDCRSDSLQYDGSPGLSAGNQFVRVLRAEIVGIVLLKKPTRGTVEP